MKKVIAVLLSLALMLSFAACGNKNDAPNSAPENGVSDDTPTTTPEGSKGGVLWLQYLRKN